MNPLKEFEELIQGGRIKKMYESFFTDAEMLGFNFNTPEKLDFSFAVEEEFGNIHLSHSSFKDRIDNAFSTAYLNTTILISNQIGEIISNDDRRNKIIILLDEIQYFYKQLDNKPLYYQSDIIKRWIEKLIIFLKEKYTSLNLSHPAYELISTLETPDITEGYFDFKGRLTDLTTIYNFCVSSLNLFSSDVVTISDFKKVFTSPNPKELNIKLKFNCDAGEAAYILQKFQKYFNNLTDKALADCGCFQISLGRDLDPDNFHAARSKFKSNPLKEDRISDIDNTFKLLKIAKR